MKKIGKFKVCGLLGRGGMGKVYKVEYPVTGKTGALKLLAPNPFLSSIIGEEEIESMFTAEAIKMADLRHPNITEILDFDRSEGKLYYIMEFYCNNLGTMIGESYETEKPSRKISIEKALHYTRQVLSGLSRLHFASIIHRDIKPFNILVTDHDTVKICDLGLSKLRNETFGNHKNLKIGTPYYAAPEQEKDPENVDFTCDLYSTAVMLFRMVTGRLPETGVTNPLEHNKSLDQSWLHFMEKALAINPLERYENAEAMIEALDALGELQKKGEQKTLYQPEPLPVEKLSDRLRSEPLKVKKNEAGTVFKTDVLKRPLKTVSNSFSTADAELVHDKTTRLLWQQSGTRFPVNRKQATNYINMLNKKSYGGFNTWRLPTVNELFSIITGGADCYGIAAVFDENQKWIWSSDRCSFITAWYVSMEMGYVDQNDFSAYYHVKAVCSLG